MPIRAPARSARRGSMRRNIRSASLKPRYPALPSSSFRRDAIQLCLQPVSKFIAGLDGDLVARDRDVVILYVRSLAQLDPILPGHNDWDSRRETAQEVTFRQRVVVGLDGPSSKR